MYHPDDYLERLGHFPCHDPAKDIVIPVFFSPEKYRHSPLFGGPERNRTILGFFKGDLRLRDPRMLYSRGLRQRLHNLTLENDWWGKHKIWVGADPPPGYQQGDRFSSYSALLSSSIFCFNLPGDGWTARFEDSVLHGCIPVIIMDGVDPPYANVLDIGSFSLRIAERDVERVPEILAAVPPEEVARLQAGVRSVWHRYVYTGLKAYKPLLKKVLDANAAEAQVDGMAGDGAQAAGGVVSQRERDWDQDDAFDTLIQILYSKMLH